jgi:serine protease SohB
MRARQHSGLAADADGGRLEVISLNDRYADMVDAIQGATLPPKVYKQAVKAERKAEKQRMKAEQATHKRLFVIDFHGDLMASEVGGLREMVSALLIEASAKDEVLVRIENAGGAVHEHGLAASQLLRLRERASRSRSPSTRSPPAAVI